MFTLSPAAVSEIEHSIIHGIAKSFQTFILNHSYIGQNSKKALIFNNPIFERGPKDKGILDKNFFGDGKPGKANLNNIANLKYVECWEGNNFLTMERLNENFNLVINAATYFRLRGALLYFRTKTKDSGTDPGESISDFFGSFKKGSKSCRCILSKAHVIKIRILPKNLTIFTTFFSLISLEIPNNDTLSCFLSLWTLPYLSNRFREFIFKFFNNKLGLNTRTSHFLNTDRRCTFRKLIGISDEDETFSHIFFDCPTVVTIHNTLDLHVLSRGAESNNEKKARWFGCGWLERENKFVRLLHLSLQFFIWECKLKNKLPSSGYILG